MGFLKINKKNKVVELTFETEEQASLFFDVVSDSSNAEDTRESLNTIMEYCGVDSVNTYKEA